MSAAPQKKTNSSIKPVPSFRPLTDLPPLPPLDVIDADPVALNDPDQTFLARLVLAMREKNVDLAITHTEQHLNEHKKNPALCNLMAALYLQKRDDRNAEKYLIQATKYGGQDDKVINNQACMYLLRENPKMAESLLQAGRRRQKESFAEYDYNLALAYALQNRFTEAQMVLNESLAREKLVDSYILKCRLSFALGNNDQVKRDLMEGLEHYPDAPLILYYLSRYHLMIEEARPALVYVSKAFALEPTNRYFAMLYAGLMNNVVFEQFSNDHTILISRCLSVPGVNISYLMQAWQSLLAGLPVWKEAWNDARTLTPEQADALITRLKTENQLNAPLVINGLNNLIVKGEMPERIFTALRTAYLNRILTGSAPIENEDLIFLGGLAYQLYCNEYAYIENPEEIKTLAQVQKQFNPDQVNVATLLVLCTYRSIATYLNDEQLQKLEQHPLIGRLIEQQVTNRKTEFDLMEKMPRLTAIHDDISRAVEQMYIENPYPAWARAQFSGNITSLRLNPDKSSRIQVLVAGCGTGHHAIMSALTFENTHVTAIDLSRRSLAYAQRKTDETGVPNIDYAQADILELGTLKKQFDIIESVGVLHHLADPLKGLRILLGLLKPGGLFKCGLYSETARIAMVAARDAVAEMGYASTLEGIREFRQSVLENPETHPARKLLRNGDFYTISTCRDLVFHVQEHRYTLPQLKEILANHDLEFAGFNLELPVFQQFRSMFTDNANVLDLDLWDQFEQKNPDTFANMYQFCARKRI